MRTTSALRSNLVFSMENIKRVKINHRLGVYTLAVLSPLAGFFFLREDIQGKTVTSPAAIEADSAAVLTEETTPTATPAPMIPVDSAIEATLRNPKTVEPVPSTYIDTETLWLARVIYSESKRIEEQELVAWVVRNRVETAYRGRRTYEGVALDPYQFSAFNPNSRKHRYYTTLDTNSQARGWQKTLALAYYVRYANAAHRPFPIKTRHFYSEQSLPANAVHPEWTEGLEPVTPRRPLRLEAHRFRFYTGVI